MEPQPAEKAAQLSQTATHILLLYSFRTSAHENTSEVIT